MNIKLILGAAALAVGGSLYFGKGKYDKYNTVLENLEFNLKNLKKINLFSGNITFEVDIELINPTNIAVDIPGNQILLKNLHFYAPSGTYLGVANPNVSNIQMPANGSRIITNIPVSLSLATIGRSFTEILGIVSNPDTLQIKADLDAFGKSFTV